MKPKYLLESCPNLKRLSLEWQHDLSQPPYHQYHPEWFTKMLLTPEWTELNLKLTHLVSYFASHNMFKSYMFYSGDLKSDHLKYRNVQIRTF